VHARASSPALQAYLLGRVEFQAALAFQRRLAYQAAGDRTQAALIICEHPPIITVGRQGSRTDIHYEPEDLSSRQWQIRWVNRGGGSILHLPGQFAIYPILPLDPVPTSLPAYLDCFERVLVALLDDFGVRGRAVPAHAGIAVAGRPIALTGVAVRDWVTYYGAYLNVHANLEPFRRIHSEGAGPGPMTSLERERRGPLRASLVRERLVEHFAEQFHFPRIALFSDHPSLGRRAHVNALAAST
jgi:lipoyl(octanoyl) transferase